MLLEFEWVLRGFYEFKRAEISTIFRALVGVEHVSIEDRDAILTALGAYAKGMDFADALHVARSRKAAGFLTFDRKLAKGARKAGLGVEVDVEVLG